MSEEQYNEISKKLDIITKLLATQLIQEKDYREQAQLLNNIGMQTKDIASLTGKTVNNVTVTLHLMKKNSKKKKI
jgi:hypothetical protein